MATDILNEPVVEGNPVPAVATLAPILYKNTPVLTTALLSAVYGTTQARIRENYRVNRDRFAEGKHLFKVSGDELRTLKECVRNSDSSDLIPKTGGELTLWTARGAARHAKMLNTDKAWDVFELLEENYFSRRPAVAEPACPTTGTLTPAQQQELKELVQAKASAYPDAVKPKVFSQVWMRLQRKFKVPRYSELPMAVFGEARDYVIAMQVRSVDAPALEGTEAKSLPSPTPLSTIRDYASIFRGLPDMGHWRDLSRRLVRAHDVFQAEMEAIKKEALRPFRENRRIEVGTFLDSATTEIYRKLFEIAEDGAHTAYRGAYGALLGLEGLHDMLLRG